MSSTGRNFHGPNGRLTPEAAAQAATPYTAPYAARRQDVTFPTMRLDPFEEAMVDVAQRILNGEQAVDAHENGDYYTLLEPEDYESWVDDAIRTDGDAERPDVPHPASGNPAEVIQQQVDGGIARIDEQQDVHMMDVDDGEDGVDVVGEEDNADQGVKQDDQDHGEVDDEEDEGAEDDQENGEYANHRPAPRLGQASTAGPRVRLDQQPSPATAVAGPSIPAQEALTGTPLAGQQLTWQGRSYHVIACPNNYSDGNNAPIAASLRRDPHPYHWLAFLGTRWAAHQGLSNPHTYMLDALPVGYTCGMGRFGRGMRRWVYGNPRGRFQGPGEMWPHFLHMVQNGTNQGCQCMVCQR